MGALKIVEAAPAPAPADLCPREQFAQRITDGYKRIYRDILALGAMLVEARNTLPYGEFQRMIEKELPFGKTTAYSYIREWTIAQSEDVQPAEQLNPTYTVRAEIERLTPEEIDKGLASGKLYRGVPRAEVVEYRKELRTAHQHRPASSQTPAPSRPTGAATTYSELVWSLIEWRKSKGFSQAELDARAGWGDTITSKLEIPHQDDGRLASWDTLNTWMGALGLGLTLTPVADVGEGWKRQRIAG